MHLKVLHLASFSGNIGDNANHAGAFARLALNVPLKFEVRRLEIREFYWKKRAFDQSFADLCNEHDLLMIGGGNYFELWVEKSPTGCSLELSSELLDRIRIPILFYSLGCDRYQGVPDVCRERFGKFLARISADARNFVSVRNDGSLTTLEDLFGVEAVRSVVRIPDGGFFYDPPVDHHSELAEGGFAIAVNLAGDMLNTRFPGGDRHDPGGFLDEFGGFLRRLLLEWTDVNAVLVPHIPKDIDMIAGLLRVLPDDLVRSRVRVAPFLSGASGAAKIFDLYRQSDIVLGMRFHANVCSLGRGRPTIGLACYGQISSLYREVGLEDWCVDVAQPGFSDCLTALCSELRSDHAVLEHRLADMTQRLARDIRDGHAAIARWLSTVLPEERTTGRGNGPFSLSTRS